MILSFIVPAYNAEKTLGYCLDSLLQQDVACTDYEIIIVNDGSTDNTAQIISHYQSKRPTIKAITQKNQGLSVARNNGLLKANGKYIWFIDADDKICPHCLTSLIDCCEQKQCDMLGVGPSIPFTPTFPTDFSQEKEVSNLYTGKEWMLSGEAFTGPWAYIIRKEFWINNALSFLPNTWYEDVECISRAFYYAKRIYTLSNFSVYDYVQHPESFMNSGFTIKKLFDKLIVASSLRQFCSRIKEPDISHYYERICTDFFISGISMLVKNKVDIKTSIRFISQAQDCYPRYLYATSVIQKIYQFTVIHFPLTYIRLRRIL